MSRLDRINEQRRQKLESLLAAGVSPYPHRFHRTHTAIQAVNLVNQGVEQEITAAGRIMSRRPMGKITFSDIRDGSGKIQLLFKNMDKYEEPDLTVFKNFDIGDIIGVTGKVFRTRSGEPTIEVSKFTLLAKSLQPLPEKWHRLTDVETRHRQRYIDLIINPEVKDLFYTRSRIISAIRQFMEKRGFIEVETPVLQPAAGGALAKPFITHHNALDLDLYLRIALELHLKRLIVGGFDKVYELGRVFRNEGISTKHNPEFTMMESYEAYADYNDVMSMVETMVYEVVQQVLGKDTVEFGETSINFKPPWQRLNLRQAIIDACGIDFEKYDNADALRADMAKLNIEADPNKDLGRLIDDLISTYVEPKLMQPSFLIDYPIAMSPLAKIKPGNPKVVERFEGFAGCIEIANAFTELNDPIDQRERFIEQIGKRQEAGEEKWSIDEDYLTALEYGMPPTGGLGVGIDRLVMLFTNQQSIREVILFPQLKAKTES